MLEKINRILAISRYHDIFDWVNNSRCIPVESTAYSPEQLAMSATMLSDANILFNEAYYQLCPSAIVIDSKTARIYVFKRNTEDHPYRLWIGGTITEDDFISPGYKVSMSTDRMLRGYMKIVPQHFQCNLLCFICTRKDKSHNRFGIIYTVNIASAKLKENDLFTGSWMTIAELKKIYRQIDPWSKALFDYIYEHPAIRKKLKLYQRAPYKKTKNSLT